MMGYSEDERKLMAAVEDSTAVSPLIRDLDGFIETEWLRLGAMGGVFRNTLAHTVRKPIGSKYGFVAQCDPHQRAQKRQSQAPQKLSVVRAVDPKEFNFTRASATEILCALSLGGPSDWFATRDVSMLMASSKVAEDDEDEGDDAAPVHGLLVNVSPLFHCHSLLCLHMASRLPQVLSAESLLCGLRFASMSRRADFRVGFNSLGAFASVNHLHLHSMYISDVYGEQGFPVERMPRLPFVVCDDEEVAPGYRAQVSELQGWPVRALIIEALPAEDGTVSLDVVASVAGNLLYVLQTHDIAHNVLVADHGATVFVFPRQMQCPSLGGHYKAAFAEVCGTAVIYDDELFSTITEEDIRGGLEAISLTEEEFEAVKVNFFEVYDPDRPADAAEDR